MCFYDVKYPDPEIRERALRAELMMEHIVCSQISSITLSRSPRISTRARVDLRGSRESWRGSSRRTDAWFLTSFCTVAAASAFPTARGIRARMRGLQRKANMLARPLHADAKPAYEYLLTGQGVGGKAGLNSFYRWLWKPRHLKRVVAKMGSTLGRTGPMGRRTRSVWQGRAEVGLREYFSIVMHIL
jgi:hypothetical protein